MRIGRLWVAFAALALAGCMNITLSQAIEDPGPHDSPITIIGVGALGDSAIAAAAAATHASSSDTLAFEDVIVYYALPLFALDLLVTIIRIDKYKN
ncbi:MAG TPA: hypothetical protein VM261_06730 [Kofleriaceae bacterium]|nr:hypothetical protein [Kofleriaceae bacterium]